ncbi:leucine-rich melanocyte differentiation-associated protein [Anaeramoeba flamelloides]|uniref:Leucine-rich melanocyte differentiation-associated protein n=1 Tax=Anaeramoeba flamelloides TaxID=1746091 RepID=A0AAV7ZIA7_9EUKA|nr:leucine-rich melanocyte differentiation-associated protein [Anaeramoeba flamelloides]
MTDLFGGELESTESDLETSGSSSNRKSNEDSSQESDGSEESESGESEDESSSSDEELKIVFEKGKLTILRSDITEIPKNVIIEYGPKVTSLDLSHNSLTKLEGLSSFPNLESLVVDNNVLESPLKFPKLKKLKTLWVNKNQLKDLEQLLSSVKTCFPSLRYLSMFGNPCCPNFFIGKDHEDYKRYRLYVLYKLPKLNFLDSSPVQKSEKKEAKRVGQFMSVKKPKMQNTVVLEDKQKVDINTIVKRNSKKKSAKFGYTKYRYVGKRSEGNRFIRDGQL